ncbi:MAG: TRAP transporter large permease subunit, partial [candidate division NC10 bacterium]
MIDPFNVALLGMAAVIVLVALGMPIAFVTAAVGMGGLIVLRGFGPAAVLAGGVPHSEVSSYTLVVLPFFIMMGSFAASAGITTDLYKMAKAWVGHLPGGLAIATTWGTALWSAISGSSTATAAVMGRMAVPEMLAHGYDKKLAAGSVAAGAAMDALIPPSVVMIVYGLLTESSIGPLLIAGFSPGFMEAGTFAGLSYVSARRNPASPSGGHTIGLLLSAPEMRAAAGSAAMAARILCSMVAASSVSSAAAADNRLGASPVL